MATCRIIFFALFLCASQSAHCTAAGETAAPWSAKHEQLQMALAMVQQLRDCDIARWETDHDSASDLTDIAASANEPIPKADVNSSNFGLSLTARYVSALNKGANPSLLSWCQANATLLNFWLAPGDYVKTMAFDGGVVVLFQRLPARGLVGVAFYSVNGADAKKTLQFSVTGTTMLFDRVAVNANLWDQADAAKTFAAIEGSGLSLPITLDEEADDPTWNSNLYNEGYFDDSPILAAFASLGDRWAIFADAKQRGDSAMLSKAYDAGVVDAAMAIANIADDEETRLLWLERAAKHGDSTAARQLAKSLIEDTDARNGGTFSDCLRVSDAFAAASALIEQAASSEFRDSELNSAIEGRAFAAARCKSLGPERDALVRITDRALRKSAVSNDMLNLIEAAELCTRGEFNAAALLAKPQARADIVLGKCDYFLEQNPWFYSTICGNGLIFE